MRHHDRSDEPCRCHHSYVYLDTSGGYSTQNLEHLDGRHYHQCGVNMTEISLLPDLMEQIVRQRLATAAR